MQNPKSIRLQVKTIGAPKAPKASTDAETDDSTESSTSVALMRNTRANLRVKGKGGKRVSNTLMLFPNSSASPSHQRAMPAYMAPELVPVCRVLVSSTLAIFNGLTSVTAGSQSYVADPTGNATNALGVFQWGTRFSGFQQYRLRSTEWKLIPLRQASSGDINSGYAIAFVEDDPQAGAASQAVALASYPRARVILNSETIHTVTYDSNEPSDLDLSDINTPPNKIVNGSVHQGGHCLNVYTDNGFFGFDTNASGTIPLIGIQAIYDIEFFGIGGV
jgi:hypothetical protein